MHMQARNRGGLKEREKIRKELRQASMDVNTNEYMALVYRVAAYGIDTGKLPVPPKRDKVENKRPRQFTGPETTVNQR